MVVGWLSFFFLLVENEPVLEEILLVTGLTLASGSSCSGGSSVSEGKGETHGMNHI